MIRLNRARADESEKSGRGEFVIGEMSGRLTIDEEASRGKILRRKREGTGWYLGDSKKIKRDGEMVI